MYLNFSRKEHFNCLRIATFSQKKPTFSGGSDPYCLHPHRGSAARPACGCALDPRYVRAPLRSPRWSRLRSALVVPTNMVPPLIVIRSPHLYATGSRKMPQEHVICHRNTRYATGTRDIPQEHEICHSNTRYATRTRAMPQGHEICHINT